MYFVAILSFLFLDSVFCENVFVDIEKNTILNEVSDKYLSFSVNSNLFVNEEDTYVRDCLCMEKFIYPSYMRIVVPSNLEISSFSNSNSPYVEVNKLRKSQPNISERKYTKVEQLKKLMEWMKKSRFTPFITLENGERGIWNPKTAIAVMAMAEKYSLDDCVWQLGIECRNQSSQQYIKVLKTFKLMMKVYNSEKHGEWKMSSGNVNSCVKADESEEFLTTADEYLDAITFDSQNEFEDMDFIEENNKEIVKEYLMGNGVHLWKTIELNQNASEIDKAIDWLKALGDTAKSGYSVVFKNLEENELMIPSLSYYVSLLHKKLTGRHVLEVSQGAESTGLYIFGHCANLPSGPISGGVTLFAGNSGEEPANINVKISSIYQDGHILQFILQEGAEKEIIINGKQKLDEEYFEPIVSEVKLFERLLISLPPKSFGFWVITNTDVEACYFNNEELSDKEEDQYHMYTANRFKRSLEENTEKEIDKNISDIIENFEMKAVFNGRLSTPDYETTKEINGEKTQTIFEDNNSEVRQNENDFAKIPVNTQNTAHEIDNHKLNVDTFDKEHLGTTDESKGIVAGQFSSIDEEESLEDLRKTINFMKSLRNDSSIDFEAVNKFTDNIDVDRDFVDIPVGSSLFDLESDEMKIIDSQAVDSGEINYLEDLVTLIGQLTSLMELQEEFLRVERSILQPLSPLSYSNFGENLQEVAGSEGNAMNMLKRIPRVAANDPVSNNLDENVDVLVIFKKVLLPLNETLTSDRIKEIFFDNDFDTKSGKVLRFVSENKAIVSVDLNSIEETLQEVNDLEEKPTTVTQTEESIKARQIEDVVYEPTTLSDLTDTSPVLPHLNLPKLPTVNLSENIPKINDLVNRAKNLLNNVNSGVEDSETQESQADDEIVGSPLNILPITSLRLTNSLEKTRLKMQEMRFKAQAKIAELRAKNLLNPTLHRHLLIKRDIQNQEERAQHFVKPHVIPKNKSKKFARNNRKEACLDILKEIYKQFNNIGFPKVSLKTTEINKNLSSNGLRKKRLVTFVDGIDQNVISTEVNNNDSNLINTENKIINSSTFNGSLSRAEFKDKKTISKGTRMNILSNNDKFNSQDMRNEIFNKPYETNLKNLKTKHFVKERNKIDNKISKAVYVKDSSEGSHKINAGLDAKLEDVKQEKLTKSDDDSILDSIVDRVTSLFQGMYLKVKDIYSKAGGPTL